MALTRSNIPCDETPKAPFIPPKDPSYGGVPDGGTTGQALVKASNEDGDVTWATIGGGGTPIIIDKTLSTTSTNPVENQAIGKAVADLGNQVALKADDAEVSAELATLSAAIALKADTADLDDYVEKEAGKGLSSNDYTNADKAIVAGVQTALDAKQDKLTAGQNISIEKNAQTGETVISATGGSGDSDKTFVAEYGVTTAQEILDYLDSTKEPFAPILVMRGNTYYTAIISTPGTDRVNLSTFGTIGGEGYLFNYTVTGANWSSSNIGFQTKLVSGTSIKTINGESILGSGNIDIQGGVTVDDALSETSLNPVQNRVIYGAWESMRQAMTGYLERLAALEAKLADFEETRLQMTDGTNTVDKVVLTKPYVDPTPPTPPAQTMFDLPNGLYDAEGNMLTDLWDGDYVSYDSDGDGNMTYYSVDVGRLYDQYPTMCGVVLCCGSGDKYSGFEIYSEDPYTDGKLKWVVLVSGDSADQSFRDPIWPWQGLETVYYRGDLTVPVMEQSTTINTTGTPLAWEE